MYSQWVVITAKRLEGKYAAARRNPDWDDIEWDKTDSDTKPAHDWQDDVEWNRRNPTKLTAEQKKMVSEWKKLVNMTPKQLEKFMKSAEGQIADSVDQAKTEHQAVLSHLEEIQQEQSSK